MQNDIVAPQKHEMIITRHLDAPRAKVWQAWTNPENIKKWWGPKTFTATYASIDLREDRKYLFCIRSSEGKDIWSTGIYREIVANQRLVMTNSFSDEHGNIVSAEYYGMDPNLPLESTITVSFDDHHMPSVGHEHHTMLTLQYDDVSSIRETDLQALRTCWKESFDKLADYLKNNF